MEVSGQGEQSEHWRPKAGQLMRHKHKALACPIPSRPQAPYHQLITRSCPKLILPPSQLPRLNIPFRTYLVGGDALYRVVCEQAHDQICQAGIHTRQLSVQLALWRRRRLQPRGSRRGSCTLLQLGWQSSGGGNACRCCCAGGLAKGGEVEVWAQCSAAHQFLWQRSEQRRHLQNTQVGRAVAGGSQRSSDNGGHAAL